MQLATEKSIQDCAYRLNAPNIGFFVDLLAPGLASVLWHSPTESKSVTNSKAQSHSNELWKHSLLLLSV